MKDECVNCLGYSKCTTHEQNSISWEQYLADINKLGDLIEKAGLVSEYSFVALARGGLIPGTILGYRFDKRVHVIEVSSYSDRERDAVDISIPTLLNVLKLERILLIDDLIDSGETLSKVFAAADSLDFSPFHIRSAVVYSKDLEREMTPDIVASTLPNQWICFPYDNQ